MTPSHTSQPSSIARKPARASLLVVARTLILPRWKLLLTGLGLIVVSRMCGLVLPYSSKILIDDIIGAGKYSIYTFAALVAVAVLAQAVTSFLLTIILSVEAQHMIAKLRAKVQHHVIQLPLQYFDSHKSGVLVSRVMSDVEGVRNLVGTGLVQMIGGVLQSVVALLILVNINAELTFVSLLPLAILGLVSAKAFAYVRPVFRKRGAINAEVTGRLTESLGGIRVIKGFNAEAKESEMFEAGVERIYDNVKKSLTATSFVTSTSLLLLGLANVLVMMWGGSLITSGAMSIGDYFAFTLILTFMIVPITQMANIGTQLTEAIAGLDRTEELLSEPREFDDPLRTVALPKLHGLVEFSGVSFSYSDEVEVLSDITLKAEPGTITALVGSSGSGKSTLAGLVASFYKPSKGTVIVDGHDLTRIRLEDYRQQLGLVLQENFLFDGTIRENILYAQATADDSSLNQAVKAAHVVEFVERMPQGLDTIIGERGVKLSGGQKQRVAIARALLADPRILILDEATSSLDTESERYIQDSLTTLLKGRTSFVIAHRLSTIHKADQILVLEAGKIVEQGTHAVLMAKQGRYFELYTYQARI